MTLLAYLENSGERLPKTALSTITAAQQLANQHGYAKTVAVTVGGAGAGAAALEALRYGFSEVVHLANDQLESYLAPNHAKVIADFAKRIGAQGVLALCSARGKDLMPQIAQRLQAGQASDCLEFLDGGRVKRPMYAGNILATVKVNTSIKTYTIRGSAFEPATPGDSAGFIRTERIEFTSDPSVTFISYETVKSERPELTEADVIVSGGRALKSAENFQSLIVPLADVLSAAIGASRAAVDSGYAPNDWQVGQTGKVVAPRLYIAVGISGAIQHLAGMKDSKVIVAINKDPECPIMEIADYGLVGDLFQIVPELVAALKVRFKSGIGSYA